MENELIKITTNDEGVNCVSARELHEGLEVKSRFNDWIKNRVKKYGFIENEDYICLTKNLVTQRKDGQKGIATEMDYAITLDMAKELCMVENNELGRKFRKYFIECEKKLKEITPPKLPQTYKEALIELVNTLEEKERIEEERNKIQEEKNRLIHQGKLYTTTEIAKELGFRSAVALNNDLKEKKIQYKVNGHWVLCAKYSEKGYKSEKQKELPNGVIVYDGRWTGEGRDWLINEIYVNMGKGE